MAKKFPGYFHCPTEFTLAVLGGKWKTVILCYLKEQPCRYSDLRALLPTLSDKVLTERLKDLMATGLVVQRERGVRGSGSVYVLTPKGRSLNHLLHALYEWGHVHAGEFRVEVGEPLEEYRRRDRPGG